MFPDLFYQLKYSLWKEKLSEAKEQFFPNKALDYLEIELSKFNIEQSNHNPFYLTILSALIIAAFWRAIDDMQLDQHIKLIVDCFVLYISHKFFVFKFYIFQDEKKKLLLFKQFLLRLKAESD